MERFVGIDFGTTNSAVAVCGPSGPAELALLAGAQVMRTVLYFSPTGEVLAGTPGIQRYLANEHDGRLIQSIKSHLASKSFKRTRIHNHSWTLAELVGRFVRALREHATYDLGRRAVVGRPVRYWGADSVEDDDRAISRMREALELAGFDEVEFVPEPMAAASAYAERVDDRQHAVIADFGGGTSDFSVLSIEPGQPARVLANSGVGIGGDSFDAEIIDRAVAPILGKGESYQTEFGEPAPVPSWLYSRLRRWHLLSFLKEAKTMALLERIIRGGGSGTAGVERLQVLIEEDLGLSLHTSVEGAKVAISSGERAMLDFREPGISFVRPVLRDDFDHWIAGELERIRGTIREAMAQAELQPGSVSRVFATGGSSLVPAVKALLRGEFPSAELVGGEELTSVASGLAYRARDAFG